MGILDGILGQVTQNVDVANLATKVGLDPAMVEKAIQALAGAHTAPGDTLGTAAAETGLPTDKLAEIVKHIGGEGALGNFASMLGQGGAGDMLGKLGGMFGKG